MCKLFVKRTRKKRSKLYRYTNWTITVICLAYCALLAFPSALFAYSTQAGQFEIYSDRPIAKNIEMVVDAATSRLTNSEFYSPDDSFRIYIAADSWRRRILSPRSSRTFGVASTLTGNTVLNRCDIERDQVFSDHAEFNTRPLHAVIAHECTHHMVANELGLIAYHRLPKWKNEGYCEYIAGGSSFGFDRGLKLLQNGQSHDSGAFRYLTFQMAVRYQIDEAGMDAKSLFVTQMDFKELLDLATSSHQ